ncbi:MAG: mannose-6-phosphate isomerase [Erysipelotrichia bacterium]|nr:mannose-6-phosphate isomerase [Erysipelotrichia bacterium]
MYPFRLKPIYDQTIWANNRLSKIRGVQEEGKGTCWEVSAHPYCQNIIENGSLQGKNLLEAIEEYQDLILGKHPYEHMLRLAYLDAKDDLSIQVHPYDSYARKHENDGGKSESWYVLEADPNATLVAGTTIDDKAKIKQAIQDENLEQYLRKVEMKAGDFIFIPAGMLHALGGGILAIEVGTNSNTTYRFYDYGRKDANGKGRELHIDKSFDVVDLTLQSEKISTPLVDDVAQRKVLLDCDEFTVVLYDVLDSLTLDTEGKDFHTITFVHNAGEVVYEEESIKANYTETIFVPASCGKYTIKGKCRILLSFAK